MNACLVHVRETMIMTRSTFIRGAQATGLRTEAVSDGDVIEERSALQYNQGITLLPKVEGYKISLPAEEGLDGVGWVLTPRLVANPFRF